MTRLDSMLGIATTVFLVAGCALHGGHGGPRPTRDYSDQAELDDFNELAGRLHLKFDHVVKSGADGNGIGIRSETLLFSRRTDSRTFFVQDRNHGVGRPNGAFEGKSEEMLRITHEVMNTLGIPRAEMGREAVLQERMREARLGPNGEPVLGEIKEGRRIARIERQIETLPVFASHAVVSLNRDGQVGSLEVHWPEVPRPVVDEAHRLAFKVSRGWKPPERERATVESIEAGIIHSGTVGTLMDVYPAIRVAYAPTEKQVGTKVLEYFDRAGRPLPLPRNLDVPCQPQAPRPAGGRKSAGNRPRR